MVTATMLRTRPPGPYAALGQHIKALRDRRGLSQRDFANQVNISPGYPPKIENGDNRPDPQILRRMAVVLDCDYTELAVKAGYIDEPEGDVPVMAPHGKTPFLTRLSGYTVDQLERIERMARIMLLPGEPAEPHVQGQHDVEEDAHEQ